MIFKEVEILENMDSFNNAIWECRRKPEAMKLWI